MEDIQPEEISEDDLIFCNHRVLGFSFTAKTWGAFAIPMLHEVTWDTTAIDKLIIDETRLHLISALVKGYGAEGNKFDDIVKGKGEALVGLFSGAPGTGKTLTVEVVTESSHKPLYVVTAGELGTEPQEPDKTLDAITSTAHRWGCVL